MDRFLLASNPLSKKPETFVIDTLKGVYFEILPDGQLGAIPVRRHTDIQGKELLSSIKQADRWLRSYQESKTTSAKPRSDQQ